MIISVEERNVCFNQKYISWLYISRTITWDIHTHWKNRMYSATNFWYSTMAWWNIFDTKYASTNLKTNCHTQPTSFLYRYGRLLHEVLSNKAVITFMRSIITNVNNFFYCFISNFTPQNKYIHCTNQTDLKG